MTNKSNYIHCKPLQSLINQKRLPMLFIGSGLSKRYLKNYPNWNSLILSLAADVGISEEQILAIKQEVTERNPNCLQSEIYKVIGTRITEKLRKDIEQGNKKLCDFFAQEEIEFIKNKNVSFIKMLIAKKFSSYENLVTTKLSNEITELKKLQNNIGVVITTNYDTFLEKNIFSNFSCYIEQSQYYMSDSEGIGEIYKIHGSITNPNTIVFNSEDYENFNKNLRVIAAKILTLLLDYPLIFFGYSLEDENILSILYTLMDCLNDKQLSTLSNRLIYVTWKENENRLVVTRKSVSKDGKTLNLTNIETDNFFVIYKYLQRFYPSEKPERVRKFKRMIRSVINKNTCGTNSILTTEENLDMLNDENNLVIAFGSSEELAEKGLIGLNINDLCNKVLNQQKHPIEYCERIIEKWYIGNARIPSSFFVPVFYFIKHTHKFDANPKILELKRNTTNYVEKLLEDNSIAIISNRDKFYENLKAQQKSKIVKVLIKTYAKDLISYDEYLNYIKRVAADSNMDYPIDHTEIRKAITYADLK